MQVFCPALTARVFRGCVVAPYITRVRSLALPCSLRLLSWRPLRGIEKSGLDVDSSASSGTEVLELWMAKVRQIFWSASAAVDAYTIDISRHSTTSTLI